MITTTARPNLTTSPILVFCPRCKDRVRFEACSVNETVCTCTVARWGYAHNVLRFETIKAKITDHKCDARCLNAKGGNCECSCGGANHGKGH